MTEPLLPEPEPMDEPSRTLEGREGSFRGRARVAVTRPPGKAEELGALLEELGLEPVIVPLIRIVPPHDPEPLREAAERLRAEPGSWDLLLFTSANAVHAFRRALDSAGALPLGSPPEVAAIGSVTAQAVRELGLEPEMVPEDAVAEAFLTELVRRFGSDDGLRGFRVLFPRAEQAREVLPEGLRARGALVDVVEAYRTIPDHEAARRLARTVEEGAVDVLTFTSASTARAFLAGVVPGWKPPPTLVVAAIGPVTADAARSGGLAVEVVTAERTAAALARSVAEWVRTRRRPDRRADARE